MDSSAITTSQISQPPTHLDSSTRSSASVYVVQSQNQSQRAQVVDSDLLTSEEESSDMDLDVQDRTTMTYYNLKTSWKNQQQILLLKLKSKMK